MLVDVKTRDINLGRCKKRDLGEDFHKAIYNQKSL